MVQDKKKKQGGSFTQIRAAVGRWIGASKRKEPSIVSQWQDFMHGLDQNPTDRLIAYMATDLQEGGMDLISLKGAAKEEKIQEAFSLSSIADKIGQLVQSNLDSQLNREQKSFEEKTNLMDRLLQERQQRIDDAAQFQAQLKAKR